MPHCVAYPRALQTLVQVKAVQHHTLRIYGRTSGRQSGLGSVLHRWPSPLLRQGDQRCDLSPGKPPCHHAGSMWESERNGIFSVRLSSHTVSTSLTVKYSNCVCAWTRRFLALVLVSLGVPATVRFRFGAVARWQK